MVEKGLDAFEKVAATLCRDNPTIRPLIVGEGPERQRLQRSLPEAVFTGHLDGVPLGRAVASADILLNPGLTETFGNVTLEAMASGVAVVAADVPANRFLIANDSTGLLVPPASVSAFATAVQCLVADEALRRDLATSALTRGRDLTWTRTLDAALRAYSSVARPR